jgi:hypothetical protein
MDAAGLDAVQAKRLARNGDTAERGRVARCRSTAPELLYYLAGDPEALVREAVAANAATPAQASRLLAADTDPKVRVVLARRIAALAPGLAAGVHDRLQRILADALAALVEDQAVEVRAAIAEVVKDLPDAPRELILRLARDAALPVAEPVIHFSPLLTEADLLALITAPPAAVTRRCVASRPWLSERVSDAIALSPDAEATEALLANSSAAIREATLDALAERAGAHPPWHAPLVRRPRLSLRAVRALGTIVAEHLLDALASRPDVDAATAAALRSGVRARLAVAEPVESALERLTAALQRRDRPALLETLAEAAGVPQRHVERAVLLRSARALLSLSWKAGLTPGQAERLQSTLGGLEAAAVLCPMASGAWALSEAEMEWQLELLATE